MPQPRVLASARAGALAALLPLLAACAAAASAAPPPGSAAAVAPAAPVAVSASAPSVSAPAAPGAPAAPARPAVVTRTPPHGLRWAATASPAVRLATEYSGSVSLMWMDPARLRFRFVPGYSIPEGSPVTTADRTPSTWTAHLVAAFNGGFKLRDHVGGYYYRGRTVSPLRTGLAAFVVRQDGTLSVGVWGRDLRMSRSVVVVRENLRPLVDHAVVTASPSDSASTWGIANGGRPLANRTALARLPDGSLVFAYGHDVTALTLGRALVRVGAVEAVDLDMNISWPTGFVYHHTGSGLAGARINPGVVRPPSTYFHQFYKDFVAVESR